MYQKLKSEIKDIIEIVNQCPESLKEKCFELLLENFLASSQPAHAAPAVKEQATQKEEQADERVQPLTEVVTLTEEIALKDFHVKIQRFFQSNGITVDHINELYYKEDGKIMPLYETLKSTSMAECQVRLALLTAFENAYVDNNGEMAFNCEIVRTRCQTMKCYNGKNFTSYFKQNESLWEVWPEKYETNLVVTLSAEGKKELAKVLIDLAEGE